MITRIEVDGFKSLRGFSLEFESLTAVIGANGAGKSNLFDVLKLLSLLPRMNVTEAFRSLRGHIRDQFSQTKDGLGDEITIAADFLLRPDATPVHVDPSIPSFPHDLAQNSNRVRYRIHIARIARQSGMVEEIAIMGESLEPIDFAEDSWMKCHPDLASLTRYAPVDFVIGSPATTRYDFSILAGTLGGLLRTVAEELSGIRLLHPDPGKLRMPSERGAGAMLLSDGSNLPTALASTTPETRAQIRADLADLVPGFRTFEVVPNDDELRLDIEFSDGTRTPARALSDGTLRLLAVLTLLRTQPSRGIIAVEEPENGIYPGRLRALMKKFEAAVLPVPGQLPPQIILNSHSPSLVAALSHRPELLVFADLIRLQDGLRSTRMRHVRTEKAETRDHSTVSPSEIENYLDTARPEEEA
jgi:predicted ATPase